MCANLMDLGADLHTIEHEGFDYLHFDLMDGHFVPEVGLGVFVLEQVTRAQSLPVDVHLMVTEPERYIEQLIDAGASLISIHQEIKENVPNLLQRIRSQKAKTGLALKPTTALASVLPSLEFLDLILLMAYEPGIRNQKVLPGFEQRIEELSRLLEAHGAGGIDVAVDGGVSTAHIKTYKQHGANFFILGTSGLFVPHTGLSEQIDHIKQALNGQLP